MSDRRVIGAIVLQWVPLIMLIPGCGSFSSGPEKAVTEYLRALWRGDYESAYAALSEDDKTLKNFELFKSEQEAAVEILMQIKDKSFEIRHVDEEAQSAKVKVGLSAIKYGGLWKDLLDSYADSANVPSFEELKTELIQRAGDGMIVPDYIEKTFVVVKENDAWKLKFALDYKPPAFKK